MAVFDMFYMKHYQGISGIEVIVMDVAALRVMSHKFQRTQHSLLVEMYTKMNSNQLGYESINP